MCAQSLSRLKMTSRRVMRPSLSITRRHPQFRPIRSFMSLVRSCLFNVAFLSTQWQKLIQYLFRVRASQNYHHLLWSCATCTDGHPYDPKKRQQKKRNSTFYFITLSGPGRLLCVRKVMELLTSCQRENHRHLFGVRKQVNGWQCKSWTINRLIGNFTAP